MLEGEVEAAAQAQVEGMTAVAAVCSIDREKEGVQHLEQNSGQEGRR